jgi:hypothetical protein
MTAARLVSETAAVSFSNKLKGQETDCVAAVLHTYNRDDEDDVMTWHVSQFALLADSHSASMVRIEIGRDRSSEGTLRSSWICGEEDRRICDLYVWHGTGRCLKWEDGEV